MHEVSADMASAHRVLLCRLLSGRRNVYSLPVHVDIPKMKGGAVPGYSCIAAVRLTLATMSERIESRFVSMGSVEGEGGGNGFYDLQRGHVSCSLSDLTSSAFFELWSVAHGVI